MADTKPYPPAGLFVAVLSGGDVQPESWMEKLTAAYGPVAMEGGPFPFTFTNYYDNEMGQGLLKRLLLFRQLAYPDSLAEIKLHTNGIEKEISAEFGRRGRPVNLDPGLLTPGKLILASAKDFSGRVPIGKNLYAEVTMFYKRNSWQLLPWTFPDFASGIYDEFLSTAREWVKAAVRRETLLGEKERTT